MTITGSRIVATGIVLAILLAGFVDLYLLRPRQLQRPKLGGELVSHALSHQGLSRNYWLYLPPGLKPGAPVMLALHGAGGDGRQMRLLTGGQFDRLADLHGMAVVYPDGFARRWNDCRRSGGDQAVDDVGFLRALIADVAAQLGVDRARVSVVGFSSGGDMGLRLALESPGTVAALAMVGASVPAPDNMLCAAKPAKLPPIMVINGTEDRITPYQGGRVSVLGRDRGDVLSARRSAQWLSGSTRPQVTDERLAQASTDGSWVSRSAWRGEAGSVELYTVHGGGHTLPQPYVRYPRLLGHTHAQFDGIAVIGKLFITGNRRGRDPCALC